MSYDMDLVEKVSEALVKAGSTFKEDKKRAYMQAISAETNRQAKWTLEMILKNALIAEKKRSPLCDDTGIPHILIEVGEGRAITCEMIDSISEGISQGLRNLPGRPMAIKGNDYQRIEQSAGVYEDPGELLPAPFLLRKTKEDVVKAHILMFGGGPAIRGKTYRIFHKHNTQTVLDEIVSWAMDATSMLGCTPCTLAIGIGRSQFEAASLMLQALVDGSYDNQNDMEKEITDRVNNNGSGTLGLGGKTTVLATFMKVGPQRSSGVRIVCLRPCCCFEPRIYTIEL